MAAFTVVYDACVLYPAPLRDLLIRLAQTGLFQARWTEAILDEVFRSILADRPDLKPEQLSRTRELMNAAVRDCQVTGYEQLIDAMVLPDPDDRHVLAAAAHCGALVVVTANVKDFPESALAPHGIEAQPPDEFVMNLVDLAPEVVMEAVTKQAAALKKPAITVEGLLAILEKSGLTRTVAELRALRRRAEEPPAREG